MVYQRYLMAKKKILKDLLLKYLGESDIRKKKEIMEEILRETNIGKEIICEFLERKGEDIIKLNEIDPEFLESLVNEMLEYFISNLKASKNIEHRPIILKDIQEAQYNEGEIKISNRKFVPIIEKEDREHLTPKTGFAEDVNMYYSIQSNERKEEKETHEVLLPEPKIETEISEEKIILSKNIQEEKMEEYNIELKDGEPLKVSSEEIKIGKDKELFLFRKIKIGGGIALPFDKPIFIFVKSSSEYRDLMNFMFLMYIFAKELKDRGRTPKALIIDIEKEENLDEKLFLSKECNMLILRVENIDEKNLQKHVKNIEKIFVRTLLEDKYKIIFVISDSEEVINDLKMKCENLGGWCIVAHENGSFVHRLMFFLREISSEEDISPYLSQFMNNVLKYFTIKWKRDKPFWSEEVLSSLNRVIAESWKREEEYLKRVAEEFENELLFKDKFRGEIDDISKLHPQETESLEHWALKVVTLRLLFEKFDKLENVEIKSVDEEEKYIETTECALESLSDNIIENMSPEIKKIEVESVKGWKKPDIVVQKQNKRAWIEIETLKSFSNPLENVKKKLKKIVYQRASGGEYPDEVWIVIPFRKAFLYGRKIREELERIFMRSGIKIRILTIDLLRKKILELK